MPSHHECKFWCDLMLRLLARYRLDARSDTPTLLNDIVRCNRMPFLCLPSKYMAWAVGQLGSKLPTLALSILVLGVTTKYIIKLAHCAFPTCVYKEANCLASSRVFESLKSLLGVSTAFLRKPGKAIMSCLPLSVLAARD